MPTATADVVFSCRYEMGHQHRRFTVCTNCGYSELYKGGNTSNMVDLLQR